jgi:cytochrome d ubiquinol oxidase subunit I
MSGYFIVVTNAFMQHPVGYAIRPGGRLERIDAAAYLFNTWALWEYAHTMCAAVITGGFVVAAVAAYWLLMSEHVPWAKLTMRVAVVVALIASVLQLFPTGDRQGKFVAEYQRRALAAMEGKFASGSHAELGLGSHVDDPGARNA